MSKCFVTLYSPPLITKDPNIFELGELDAD